MKGYKQLTKIQRYQIESLKKGGFNFEEQSYASFETYAEHCISNNYGSKVA